MHIDVVYEDNHIIAVNKPFCIPSQGDETGDESVFSWTKEYIREKYQKPGNVYLALLHRLDRPVGGIMLLAKTSKAAARLSTQFQQRKVQKTYFAITHQPPPSDFGELQHYLRKLSGKNIMRAYTQEVAHSKLAKLTFRLRQTLTDSSLIEVHLLTGRRHQIRVQLASIGCVIIGDVKYGKTHFNPDKSICLFAQQITFTHPTLKTPMNLSLPLPSHGPWTQFSYSPV